MQGCIVAPVDGSSFGEHALPLAASLAKRTGAELHLAHVHVPLITPSGVEVVAFRGTWNETAKEQERRYLRGLVERIEARYGVRAESSLREGPVAPALEEHIRGCGAGLVVMSTHAHLRFRRLWHHGVAEHIARQLPLPVLLVRPAGETEPDLDAEPEIRRILIPLDGSPYAEAMVEHAVALGRPLGASFTLMQVVRPEVAIGYTLLGQDGHLNHHRTEAGKGAAMRYLEEVAGRMRAGGLEVDTRVVVAEDAAAAIVAVARDAGEQGPPVGLVALETHPHRAAARILGEHTADLVVHDAPVPVLLFEPPLAAAARPQPEPSALPQPSA